ncbi:MAG: hypothetical protein AAFY65_10910 [Pseudomonadota bacterium]
MPEWFKGAIPKDAKAVADNLELWCHDKRVVKNGFLIRALERAAEELRSLIKQRAHLEDQVRQLRDENERRF